MTTYIVRITKEVDAEDAIHAAEIARELVTQGGALTFEVMNEETGKITVVRLTS